MSLSRKHYCAVAAIIAENVRTNTNEVTLDSSDVYAIAKVQS